MATTRIEAKKTIGIQIIKQGRWILSRTKNVFNGKGKEKKSKAYLKYKSEEPSSLELLSEYRRIEENDKLCKKRPARERREEKYICIERKGRPGILSDDWNAPSDVIDLYEYLVNHENEAA